MQVLETKKDAIEVKSSKMSPFLQMEYFECCLKKHDLELEAKKFCHENLSKLYEAKGMYGVSAGHMNILANLVVSFKDKIKFHLREAEILIKSEEYDLADKALVNAMKSANGSEKNDINNRIRTFYRQEAQNYEKQNKFNKSAKIYEKLFSTSTNESEKTELKNKLMVIYERLGKVKELFNLKSRA